MSSAWRLLTAEELQKHYPHYTDILAAMAETDPEQPAVGSAPAGIYDDCHFVLFKGGEVSLPPVDIGLSELYGILLVLNALHVEGEGAAVSANAPPRVAKLP